MWTFLKILKIIFEKLFDYSFFCYPATSHDTESTSSSALQKKRFILEYTGGLTIIDENGRVLVNLWYGILCIAIYI